VAVNVIEIKEPELNATLVGEAIAEQLSKRASFRRTMKQHCEAAMNAGAKGVKIICAGRLAGSEMARRETQKLGSIPLHTLDANVDYAVATSRTTYGTIGVKVWIYKGKFGEEAERSARRRPRPPRRTGPVQKRGRLKVTPVESDKIATEVEKIAPAPPAESGGGEQTSTEGNGLGVDSG
jgi:small subunit ribosomal protein S3